ncbi:methylenetetrahydrofolate reductase [NAD(P)H] [Capillibacterium thermochitinicola]|uniref:Methylenetetrahydrofolate reductase n=1 Tax=Capillibacterium thermochitinicola TaxID=2699427 RepID=A0A8J6I2C7_9FIRM|nr:methylenetetrahydrofolate reductase [NAD(P)H] [Capillibacterium thermochitinicola]MBA2133963.1 methylenetetrahydrofolate reductase [NAD(P)H] [Capillibacterium thermochitinicola]
MRIKDYYKNKPVFSLEIFPPKPGSPLDGVFATIDALSVLRPDFISVTYGAAGGSRFYTVEIADTIKNKYGIEALAHLTCINSTKEEVAEILGRLQKAKIENILALRGDRPADQSTIPPTTDFQYASDLIKFIKTKADFCIGAACYPEVHIEAEDAMADLHNLKRKVETGADFLITQLFLDNSIFYAFREKLDKLAIGVPVAAGIMPVLNKKQIERITSLCGASIPPKFRRILDRYENSPEALKEAGIAYATEQIIDLLSSGVDGIHLYTMNRPEVAKTIFGQISGIRKHLKAET